TPVISAAKLPILNLNEFDLWKMRIEQYFLMTDYSLWEVIINGDSPIPSVVIEGAAAPAAIEKRFGGNTKTKKVQKTLLKQQFENFTGSSFEGLDQIHDRLQKLVSQLEIHEIDNEDLKQIDVNDLEEMDLRWVQPSRGYNVVPPPITGNFMPPKPDLPVEATILDDTPKPTSSNTNGSRKRKNRKTCFVCRSVDHLIKDCNFHTKPKSQPTPRNSACRGYDKQYASSTKKYLQKHIVPVVVLTKSKPVSVTAARPVSDDVPKIIATKPRHVRSLHTNPNSIIIRHKTRSKFSKTSNSSPKVTAANAKIDSAAKGKKGKWVWRPKQHILDHDSSASKLLKQFDHVDKK
nr:hypothetical protein [Tanacetum cinerariifolium]